MVHIWQQVQQQLTLFSTSLIQELLQITPSHIQKNSCFLIQIIIHNPTIKHIDKLPEERNLDMLSSSSSNIRYWCGFFKIVIRKKDFLRFDNKTMPNFIIDFTNDFFLQFICFFQHNTDENNSTGYIKPKQKPPRPGMCNEQFIK